MKRLPDFFWVVLVLTSIASGSQLCFVPENPETLPSLVCRSRSPVPFSLASLHISGIRLGDTLGEIASRYEVVGQEDGWVIFGWYDIDPESRFLRPFLAAQFDQDGKAIVLRGPGIGYEELVGWKELTASGLIPIAGYHSVGSSCPPEFATHHVPGIRLVHVKGKPAEYFIGDPKTLAQLRPESKDGVFRWIIDD